MSKCTLNYWKMESRRERPINTEATKELQARLVAMTKERDQQDKMWTSVADGKILECSKQSETVVASRSKQINTILQ